MLYDAGDVTLGSRDPLHRFVEKSIVATKKRKRAKKMDSGEATVSFEDSLDKIEESVARLESGNLGLADALKEYEHGIGSLKQCHELLERAEHKIELLTGLDADGNPVSQPYEHQAAAQGDSPSTVGRAGNRRSDPAGEARSHAKTRGSEDIDEAKRLF